MVISISNKHVDIQTTDGVWFNMNYEQMEQIRTAIQIIENVDATVDVVTLRVVATIPAIKENKED